SGASARRRQNRASGSLPARTACAMALKSGGRADGDLMGDGVNVAARLEGICEPGGVCLSDDAYRQVKSRLELQVADLGPQNLKNIAEPVHAYLLRQGAPATQKSPQGAKRTGGVWARWPALAAALVLVLLAAGAFGWRAGYAPRFM